MPRAVDPSLYGGGLPVDHNPMLRTPTGVVNSPVDIGTLLQQLVDGWTQFLEDYLLPIIKDVTGLDLTALGTVLKDLDFSSPEAFLMSLVNAIAALPEVILSLLPSLIDGLVSSPDQLTSLLSGLIELLVTLPGLLIDLASSLLGFGNILGTGSPLDSLNLFNLVPTDLLGMLNVSNIGTAITNLLTDPNFLDTTAFSGGGSWLQDLTGGVGGTGTAYTTANGSLQELLGNLIPVSQGQTLNLSGMLKWTGLVGTGSPVGIGVTGYQAGNPTTQAVVASHNTTPPTTDWVTLTGTYTVPANVDAIRTRLFVLPAATAGTVHFSQMSAAKTGPLLQNLIGGTNPGTLLPDDITNLFSGIASNASDILNRVLSGDFQSLISSLGGTGTGLSAQLTSIENLLASFLDGSSQLDGSNINTGSILNDFIPGIGSIQDGVTTTVGGLTGSGFDINKMIEALSGQTHAVVDNGAGVTNMFARLSILESKVSALPVAGGGTGAGLADGGAIGVTDTDTLERVSTTSLGGDWIQVYSAGGNIWATPNGHDASFSSNNTNDCDFLAIRNVGGAVSRSQTDYQRVTIEVGSKATRYNDPLFGTFDYTGHNDVWLRISDASTSLANVTGVRIRFGGNGSISITRFVSGAATVLASLPADSIVPPGPGAQLIGEAGILSNGAPRYFRAKIGASVRLGVQETGTASGLGAAYRRFGHGGRAEGHLLGQEIPGSIHYVNLMDETTATT